MQFLAHIHTHIGDQVAGAVVRSAAYHTVGALMRGHGVVGVIVIAVLLVGIVWVTKKLF